MNNRQRNRLLRILRLAICAACLIGLVVPMVIADRRRGVVLAIVSGGLLIWVFVDHFRGERMMHSFEKDLVGDRQDPDVVFADEPREKFAPLARDREELITGIIGLALLVVIAILYYTGFLSRIFGA